MYYILRVSFLFFVSFIDYMESYKILIDVEKFKEILIYSWHLLPLEKQQELINIGVHPQRTVPKF